MLLLATREKKKNVIDLSHKIFLLYASAYKNPDNLKVFLLLKKKGLTRGGKRTGKQVFQAITLSTPLTSVLFTSKASQNRAPEFCTGMACAPLPMLMVDQSMDSGSPESGRLAIMVGRLVATCQW